MIKAFACFGGDFDELWYFSLSPFFPLTLAPSTSSGRALSHEGERGVWGEREVGPSPWPSPTGGRGDLGGRGENAWDSGRSILFITSRCLREPCVLNTAWSSSVIPVGAVEHEEQHVGFGYRVFGSANAFAFDAVLRLSQSGRIQQAQGDAPDVHVIRRSRRGSCRVDPIRSRGPASVAR